MIPVIIRPISSILNVTPLALALIVPAACAFPSVTSVQAESTDTENESNISESKLDAESDLHLSSTFSTSEDSDENESAPEESNIDPDTESSSIPESTSSSESDSLSGEDTLSIEEEEDSGPKFDLMIPPDMPIGPSNCEEEGLGDPAAGIYCVRRGSHGISLIDSDGDGRVEIIVSNVDSFSIFEQTLNHWEKSADSPLRYPKVGHKSQFRPSRAKIIALPRVQSSIQDWLISWSEIIIDAGDIATAEVMHAHDSSDRFVYSDPRSPGDWLPQVLRLEHSFAAAYLDQQGTLTVRTRNAQNQWSPPIYYNGHRGSVNALETADLNHDGHGDFIVIAYYDHSDQMNGLDFRQGIAVRFGDGQGDFSRLIHNPLDIPAIVQGKVGDVTGDGLIDVILMGDQNLHVVRGLNDGLFDVDHLQTVDFSNERHWSLSALHVADFNGDQRIDVALSDCEHNLLHVLLASPDGQLVLTNSIPTLDCVRSNSADSLHTLDVDHDGHLDLLALGEETETLRVYFGNGEGLFVVQ